MYAKEASTLLLAEADKYTRCDPDQLSPHASYPSMQLLPLLLLLLAPELLAAPARGALHSIVHPPDSALPPPTAPPTARAAAAACPAALTARR